MDEGMNEGWMQKELTGSRAEITDNKTSKGKKN